MLQVHPEGGRSVEGRCQPLGQVVGHVLMFLEHTFNNGDWNLEARCQVLRVEPQGFQELHTQDLTWRRAGSSVGFTGQGFVSLIWIDSLISLYQRGGTSAAVGSTLGREVT